MSNSAVLSHSHSVIRAKKRARQEQIKEVVFDDDARREFLTGFHKRKLQRTEEKRKKAQERDKQQRLEARREGRKALAEQAKKNAAAVEQALGAVLAFDDEADESGDNGARDDAMEFEDEEQLATVTVVEDFTTDDLILGPESKRPKRPRASSSSPQPDRTQSADEDRDDEDAPRTQAKTKTKAPKFRYETKAARKAAKDKQKARQTYKAAAARTSSNKKPHKARPSKRR